MIYIFLYINRYIHRDQMSETHIVRYNTERKKVNVCVCGGGGPGGLCMCVCAYMCVFIKQHNITK